MIPNIDELSKRIYNVMLTVCARSCLASQYCRLGEYHWPKNVYGLVCGDELGFKTVCRRMLYHVLEVDPECYCYDLSIIANTFSVFCLSEKMRIE